MNSPSLIDVKTLTLTCSLIMKCSYMLIILCTLLRLLAMIGAIIWWSWIVCPGQSEPQILWIYQCLIVSFSWTNIWGGYADATQDGGFIQFTYLSACTPWHPGWFNFLFPILHFFSIALYLKHIDILSSILPYFNTVTPVFLSFIEPSQNNQFSSF